MIKIINIFILLTLVSCTNIYKPEAKRVVINKDNGNIILAYKGFENFLKSKKDWEDYEKHVLKAYPTLMSIHQKYIKYNLIDSILYKKEVSDYNLDSFKYHLDKISDKKINKLYDSIIQQMDSILYPLDSIDVCFFLPYGRDCFVENVLGKKTVFISIQYDIEEMDLILIHEYAHILHHQRKPYESPVLIDWIVSEGIASYFPLVLSESYSIYDGLWMMPKENIDWCIANERQIIDSMLGDLNNKGIALELKYIAGGKGFATPPRGFPEKTAYYIGYRVVENCYKKGIPLSEICKMDSKSIIDVSEVFKN